MKDQPTNRIKRSTASLIKEAPEGFAQKKGNTRIKGAKVPRILHKNGQDPSTSFIICTKGGKS